MAEPNRTAALPADLHALALAQVANAVFITDVHGRIIWVNEAFTRMSGYALDDAVGRTPRLLKSGVQSEDLYTHLWQTIRAGRPWHGELVNRHRDGGLYTVRQTITPLLDGDGAPTHFIAVHEDVTPLRTSQARMRALFDQIPDAVLLLDDDGTILEANPAASRMTGYHDDDLTGRDLELVLPVAQHDWFDRVYAALLNEGRLSGSATVVRADGGRVEVEYDAIAGIVPGEHLLVARDVTDRRWLEHELRSQSTLLERRAQQQTAIAEVGRFALDTDDHTAVAVRACRYISHLLGPGVDAYVTGESPESPQATGAQHDDGDVRRFDIGPAGTLLVHLPEGGDLHDSDEEFLQSMANVLHSAVRRDQTRAQLEHLANHDLVTQLPNRTAFVALLEDARNRQWEAASAFAVVGLDLDGFKSVNDGLGHDVGDQVLRGVADRLRGEVDADHVVARLGSDEFAVLCPDVVDTDQAAAAAERMRAALTTPIETSRGSVTLSASVGWVLADGTVDGHGLLRDVATAIRAAKDIGRNQVVAFSTDMRERAMSRFDVASMVREALDNDRVVVHYQPTIDLATGRTVGVEALVRLRLPSGELASPARFLEVAEDTGLILPLGERVLEIACADTLAWAAATHGFMLAVNLSPEQLTGGSLSRHVAGLLGHHGLDPGLLWLELTESELLEVGSATAEMARLRELGVRFAIDDFGTGYSSLKQLRATNVDMLKVDRSFVGGMTDNRLDRALVVAAVDLARTFELGITAEGVETDAQREALQALGCGLAQGFLWSRPVPADQITARLAAER